MSIGKDRAKMLAKLATSKGRREQGLLLLDSLPLVDEAIALGLLQELIVEPDRHEERQAAALKSGARVTPADPAIISRIAESGEPPGAVGVAAPPPGAGWESFSASNCRIVFLEEVSNPGNVGAIARTAAAMGVAGIVLSPGCADPFSPKTLRASAGALLRLPVMRADIAEVSRSWEGSVLRAVVDGGVPVQNVSPVDRAMIWLGNEVRGAGDVPAGMECVDVNIPMSQGVQSLNVAASAAIVLWRLTGRDQ